MSTPRARRIRDRSAAIVLVLAASAMPAAAQQAAPVVTGSVVDSASGTPIAGAEVSVGAQLVRTDEQGRFRVAVAPGSRDTLRVRRLGFRTRAVALSAAAPLRLALAVIPQQLSPVVVEARWEGYTGRLAGYYQRLERRTVGQFITRADLDAEQTGLLTNLLQRMPGVQVRRGSGAPVVMMRGRNCSPLVWLDGVAMPSAMVDLDAFSPSSLHGIELYLGASSTPLRFQALRGKSECGTVVLWSRGPDTDPVGRLPGDPAALERQLASREVFTADEVDSVAAPRDGAVRVDFPQLLKATNVTDTVTVEYVVDERGHVEAESFGVVSAGDPRFAPAILESLLATAFRPAMRGGRSVRQLVRQRFSFGATG